MTVVLINAVSFLTRCLTSDDCISNSNLSLAKGWEWVRGTTTEVIVEIYYAEHAECLWVIVSSDAYKILLCYCWSIATSCITIKKLWLDGRVMHVIYQCSLTKSPNRQMNVNSCGGNHEQLHSLTRTRTFHSVLRKANCMHVLRGKQLRVEAWFWLHGLIRCQNRVVASAARVRRVASFVKSKILHLLFNA